MSKDKLIAHLRRLPGLIEKADADLLDLEAARRSLAFAIECKEAQLLASGSCDGKNSEIRSAQLRELTCPERQSLLVLEERLAAAKRIVRYRENEFSAAKSLALLLRGRR